MTRDHRETSVGGFVTTFESRTAYVAAEFRAQENRAPLPLYRDTVVELFLTNESKRAAREIAADVPLVKDLIRIRTRYFDDALDRQLRSDVRQVVILGSGLDTRAVRKAAAGVTYYEIDDAATLDRKRACFEEHGLDVDVQLIPGDSATDDVVDLLEHNGFNVALPTYIIWEGNTTYLSRERMTSVLAQLRHRLTRFRMSFDYMPEAVDIRSVARELGLTVFESFRMAHLFMLYRRRCRFPSPIFHFSSVCTVGQ
jgi:methyltransferase (TIGR00027 family)